MIRLARGGCGCDEELITPREFGEKFGFCINTVYSMLRAGEIPARKVRGRWFICASKAAAVFGVGDDGG